MNTEDDLEIVGFDRTSNGVADIDRWTDLVITTLKGESVLRGRLDLIFVDEAEMAELNETHMGHQGPTDVLSFPLDGDDGDVGGDDDDDIFANLADLDDETNQPPLHLGDIVICPVVADRQAPEHAGNFLAEMTLLVIHGTLHILGHDHAEPDEADVMQGRERVHMADAGFDHPRWAGSR
jgi:probable rRNA maturation factor